ncbi:MAG: YbaB/EbfC family nucleoid-associated protein [Candidatus Atribacteria bacterium]|jgi:DNA-binding YbaB/EbfC family protein|uniref:Nucleoid-associated protein A2V47_00915 n=1 Tax=Candidatus Sediminicultor quintus TaxID=1797291 RepID=A0A1F5AE20_9BACT|nr:YbaB/EbfC family nucleoid-associated protein [Candidatus Atribacteria bacterium]MBE3091130.1 YbaB/EbfC family nucleoid-associated protein [Candidatus Atribacteria bacterium]MBE3113706.1 YbaB/EbfC family nucleoid-associated protein [Actinomycetota bacterium]MBE3127940.1 YbaB/EbfC family nucleoid-associated protein [Candidatus Atribacteria bacterium]OGD16164.1 MAG: nucleoid-associated protein, YbaB/EbfC family [Candidatus Atribacteria bacterium RBG_19FT_COMBO_35_14]
MDMKFLMKQAQVMQKKMEEMKEELAQKEVRVSSGGGIIEIVINGQQEIKEIKIEPDVIDANEKEMLEDLILAAVNESIRQSKELAAQEMSKLTGGMNVPGLF